MSVFESVSYVRDIQTHTYQPATLVSQYTTRSFSVRACIQYLYTCVYTYDVHVSLKRCTRDSGKYGGQDIHWMQQKKRNPNFILMLQLSILSVCVRFNCYCVVRGEYETERENDKIEKKKKRKKKKPKQMKRMKKTERYRWVFWGFVERREKERTLGRKLRLLYPNENAQTFLFIVI